MVGSGFRMRLVAIVGTIVFSANALTGEASHYELGVKAAADGKYEKAAREFTLEKQQHPGLAGIDKQIGLALFPR